MIDQHRLERLHGLRAEYFEQCQPWIDMLVKIHNLSGMRVMLDPKTHQVIKCEPDTGWAKEAIAIAEQHLDALAEKFHRRSAEIVGGYSTIYEATREHPSCFIKTKSCDCAGKNIPREVKSVDPLKNAGYQFQCSACGGVL